jgi:hypothetical protein
MRKLLVSLAALTGLVTVGLATAPATVAGAAGGGAWVSNVAPVSAPGNSCTHPGYSTIQSAINAVASGTVIHICSGTYTEQLTITKSLSLTAVGSVTVKLPASPVNSTTSCDNAIGAVSQQPQDAVSICGAGTVSITGITVSAFWPAGFCYDSLYGIFVGQGSNLVSNKLAVDGAGVPVGDSAVGCQGGVAIQVGSARPTPNEAATATLKNTTVSNYQKNGINATGTGVSVTVDKATVTGRGPVGTAENGIEVAFGAKGTITGATVSNNQCVLAGVCGPNGLNNTQASGVLLYGAAPGTVITKSSISNNDMGVYYGSSAATEPASPEVTIKGNQFSGTADEQILLDQGRASVVQNTISGPGNVGIQVQQYSGQTYAAASTASHDTISGQGIGVQVLSDNAATGDFPGVFNISHSTYLFGNTQASQDNSTNYSIQGSGNH